MPGIRPAAFLSSYFFPGKGMREWTLDRRPGKWTVNEKLLHAGAVGPDKSSFDHPAAVRRHWHDADRVPTPQRAAPVGSGAVWRASTRLLPARFGKSLELFGLKMRKIVLANAVLIGSAPFTSGP